MEQHPVPRNITGFQFKLIGDMTLRQFGYLAFAAVLAYILFKSLPLGFVINITLAGLVFFIGFAFAFLPYQDRPLDQWLTAFVKSISAPTEFMYLKDNNPPDILLHTTVSAVHAKTKQYSQQYKTSKQMLEVYLNKISAAKGDSYEQNERMRVAQALNLFAGRGQVMMSKRTGQSFTPSQSLLRQKLAGNAGNIPIEEALKQRSVPEPVHKAQEREEEKKEKPQANEAKITELSGELTRLKAQIGQGVQTQKYDPQLAQKFRDLEAKINSLLTDREHLTGELAAIKQQASVAGNMVKPSQAVEADRSEPMKVKMVGQKKATSLGFLNLPTTPNVVIGVVNDHTGLGLTNILITVKDLRGTPLRALKTNKLGQFFASTPLSNGTYVLEVEDPVKKYAFDLIEIKLLGNIFAPLEITAKKAIDPVREKLTKELFERQF